MESSNWCLGFGTFAYTQENAPTLSFPIVSASSSSHDSLSMTSSKANEVVTLHQRCMSESLLVEEEPYWLEDLLSEPATGTQKGHRRSVSDSYAYLGAAAEQFCFYEEPDFKDSTVGASFDVSKFVCPKDLIHVSASTSPNSLDDKASHESIEGEKHNKDESGAQNVESSSGDANNQQKKASTSKSEAKRAKQQSAHRARVRKLQHIAELERTVQALEAEESVVSAELEFIDLHNLILCMETTALRHRLDSVTQEYLIKHMEQEMLERELARLQALYQLQQQLQQQPQQQQQYSKHRRSKTVKNNEINPSRASPVNHPVRTQ